MLNDVCFEMPIRETRWVYMRLEERISHRLGFIENVSFPAVV